MISDEILVHFDFLVCVHICYNRFFLDSLLIGVFYQHFCAASDLLQKNGASHEELRDYLQRYIEVIRRYPYGYTLVNLFTKRVSTQKGSTLPNVLRSLVAIPEYDISYTDGLVGTITRRTK